MHNNISELLYQWARNHPGDGKSDSNIYAEKFRIYAAECSHITEFGTCHGVSAGAFISGIPKEFHAYDLVRQPNIDFIEEAAKLLGVKFTFHKEDTRIATIKETDLLFVDSLHRYSTVSRELRNANKVRKYIIFHDTTKFWEREPGNPCYVEGIGRAIQELMDTGSWRIIEHYKEGCGLMVLERIE